MIPFAPPHIDQKIIDAVTGTLKSGWITTGPQTKLFEKKIAEFCQGQSALCLNSATAGLEIMLRWFGVREGDEVIVPAYTYSATANVIIHCGARPVFVDVNESDFNINVSEIKKAITSRTKVIMPVDFAGFPCDYDELNALVNLPGIKSMFKAESENQVKLGRILILSDSAHSLGGIYKNKPTGALCDISVFSFHAVKNLSTAEGGAVVLNLPPPFNNAEVYSFLTVYTLHGQNKDALAKMQKGNWRYDIIEAGYKCNMTDIMASMGLVELERYREDTLKQRKNIFDQYTESFSKNSSLIVPPYENKEKRSSYHVYALRVKNCNEAQRDAIIKEIFENEVSVNVHFIPVPMLSYYQKLGYSIADFPVTYGNYSCEISLPVFYDMTDEQIQRVVEVVEKSVKEIIGS